MSLYGPGCICSPGAPCDYHAATCKTCPGGRCKGHPVVIRTAMRVTTYGADLLLNEIRGTGFLEVRGIEVFIEPDPEPMLTLDGTNVEAAVFVKVKAPTEFAAGVGVGFLAAYARHTVPSGDVRFEEGSVG